MKKGKTKKKTNKLKIQITGQRYRFDAWQSKKHAIQPSDSATASKETHLKGGALSCCSTVR